jgi:Zn-finger nucleic acid-binding protein
MFIIKKDDMKCPNCDETLLMSDKNGIEIDYCPSCRGIWLDRGELDKIIERSTAHYSEKENYKADNERYYSKDLGSASRPHHKRKESFFGDLFDF